MTHRYVYNFRPLIQWANCFNTGLLLGYLELIQVVYINPIVWFNYLLNFQLEKHFSILWNTHLKTYLFILSIVSTKKLSFICTKTPSCFHIIIPQGTVITEIWFKTKINLHNLKVLNKDGTFIVQYKSFWSNPKTIHHKLVRITAIKSWNIAASYHLFCDFYN